jgi:hypothetical protein
VFEPKCNLTVFFLLQIITIKIHVLEIVNLC